MKKIVCLSVLCLLMCALTYMAVSASSAQAAGFALYEWDNRANGMGGAVIASTTPKPSAIAYNPAGITKLEGIQAQVGATIIAPSAHVKVERAGDDAAENDVDVKNRVFVVPHAYATYQISDRWWFGIGEFSRFGLGTHYDHNWSGAANVYKINLETFSVQPTVGFKINEQCSIALGFEYLYGRMDLRRNMYKHPVLGPFGLGDDWRMDLDGYGHSWNVSALWTPVDWFSMGITYRAGFTFMGEGNVDFDNDAGDDSMRMYADFPASWSVGMNFQAADNWTIEADFIFTAWSDFDSMNFLFTDKSDAAIRGVSSRLTSVKNYNDVIRLQLGTEYEAWDGIFLRGGFVFDESPQNEEYVDYMLPSNDRYIASTGLGFEFGNFGLDFSAMYLWAKDRSFNNAVAGTYPTEVTDSKTWLGGVSVNYAF